MQYVDLETSEDVKAEQLDFPLECPVGFKVIGSCNGLLCIAIKKERYLFWNPWTGIYRKLAAASPLEDFSDKFGFGYNQSTNDYKTVRFPYSGERDVLSPNLAEIYSSNTNSWKKCSLDWRVISIVSKSGTFVNGALHWLEFSVNKFEHITFLGGEEGFLDEEDNCGVRVAEVVFTALHYDMAEDKFSVLQPPEFLGNKRPELRMGVFDNCFCLVQYLDGGNICMWGRKHGKNISWKKLIQIPYWEELPCDRFAGPVCFLKKDQVLMIIKNKKVMDYRLDDDDGNGNDNNGGVKEGVEKDTFFLYHLGEKAFKKLDIQDAKYLERVILYTQSLVSLPISINGGETRRLDSFMKHYFYLIFLNLISSCLMEFVLSPGFWKRRRHNRRLLSPRKPVA